MTRPFDLRLLFLENESKPGNRSFQKSMFKLYKSSSGYSNNLQQKDKHFL